MNAIFKFSPQDLLEVFIEPCSEKSNGTFERLSHYEIADWVNTLLGGTRHFNSKFVKKILEGLECKKTHNSDGRYLVRRRSLSEIEA